jgi:C_GCAxxG_C_C family probable redox protein
LQKIFIKKEIDMTEPSMYHSQGYNCAEALIKSYNEEHNTDIPISLGSGMGTGIAVGSLCGAVNAAAMIIGYIKGRESNQDINVARAYSRELMKNIRENFDSEICLELKQNGVSCAEIIDHSYDALKELLSR